MASRRDREIDALRTQAVELRAQNSALKQTIRIIGDHLRDADETPEQAIVRALREWKIKQAAKANAARVVAELAPKT